MGTRALEVDATPVTTPPDLIGGLSHDAIRSFFRPIPVGTDVQVNLVDGRQLIVQYCGAGRHPAINIIRERSSSGEAWQTVVRKQTFLPRDDLCVANLCVESPPTCDNSSSTKNTITQAHNKRHGGDRKRTRSHDRDHQ